MTEKGVKIKFKIKIDRRALRFLENLEDYKYNHLIEQLFNLESEPRPVGCVKLNVENWYRIKWSNYRILFTVDDSAKIVEIYKIGHRKDVYKKK